MLPLQDSSHGHLTLSCVGRTWQFCLTVHCGFIMFLHMLAELLHPVKRLLTRTPLTRQLQLQLLSAQGAFTRRGHHAALNIKHNVWSSSLLKHSKVICQIQYDCKFVLHIAAISSYPPIAVRLSLKAINNHLQYMNRGKMITCNIEQLRRTSSFIKSKL